MNTMRHKYFGADNVGMHSVMAGAAGRAMCKLAKSFALVLSFAGLLLGATEANAAACNSTGVGPLNWNAIATWSCGHVPLSVDDVTIINNSTVTVNIAGAVANSVTIATGNRLSSLTFSAASSTLTVTTNVTINPPTSTATRTKQILVNAGTLTVNGNVTMTGAGGNTTTLTTLDVTTGTITILGGLTNTVGGGVGRAVASISGTGLINVQGAAGVTNGDTVTVGTGALNVTGGAFINNNAVTVSTGLINVAGAFTNTVAGDTVTITGTGGRLTVGGALTNAGSIIFNAVAGGIVNANGAFTSIGVVTNTTAGFLNIGGNATVNGTFTAGLGTVTFNGSVAQTLGGMAQTFNNLTVANAGAGTTTLVVNATVGGTLTLGANTLTSGMSTLTLLGNCATNSGNGSLSRTSGYVIGNLQLTFPTTASTCIYHVGDSTGYAPMTVALGATTGGTLTGRVDAGDHPDTASSGSGIDATKSANHYWTLTTGTLPSSITYAATFQFCANTGLCTTAEVDSGANTGNFMVAFKSAGIWSTQTTGARNAYATQATGISSFGEFAIGEISTNNCFSDSFTGADNSSPGTNWSVGNKSGTFGNPVIFGNRLRLTNATLGVATWATLQRMIPASGNKVTVEFDYFAYGGTHADGVGVILSDASVAPQAGAFGGSLGYAQKSNPGSDCTTVGGCPGFAGGWLGIGIDEFGNYSTSLEGRYEGSAAAIVNSVAIRGSGSGMSGYRFLQGTTTLSPAVDSVAVPVPPHRYRIVVDHTDAIHAWTSVERDTSGGGTAYTALIGCPPGVTSGCTALDVKDPGYSQSNVPASWTLSFTGSTGAATNFHEIDNLRICTVQRLAPPSLHHIKIEHGGAACTNSPATVIVKACADAACSSLYMNSVTVTLNSAPGGTWAPVSPIAFSGGQATVTLTDATVRADTLGATATSPTAGFATQCFNGATQTCSLSFAACAFDVIEVGAAANTPIFTKLASTTFNLDVLKLSAGNLSATAVALVDASSGTCSTYALLANTSTALPSAFSNATPRKPFSFTYANAAPNVRVRVTTAGPNYSCSSDNFAIRPQAFTVTSSATQTGSTGTPVFRAGTDTFSLTATAAATLYTGTPKLNSSLASTSLANLGSLTYVSFPPAVLGASTASGFTYSEVGNFGLSQYAVYDDAFAQVDSVKGECTSGFSNTVDANGKFSCQFGSDAAGPFGRFVPDHFTSVGVVNDACAAGGVTYMDQPVPLSSSNVVEARNAANGVTKNYVPPYAPGSVSFGAENADNGTDLSARLTLPSGNWIFGVYTLASANATFTRPATTLPDATWGSFESLDIGLTVTDGDVSTVPAVSGADMNPVVAGGSSFTYKKFAGNPLHMRFGRLKLSNAHGSELLRLPIPMAVQYWNGSQGWTQNNLDSCTSIVQNNIKLSNASVTISSLIPAGGGKWNVVLNKSTVAVSTDLCVDLDADPVGGTVCAATASANLPYLQGLWSPGSNYSNDPTARATFGVYKGNNEFIYLRESY